MDHEDLRKQKLIAEMMAKALSQVEWLQEQYAEVYKMVLDIKSQYETECEVSRKAYERIQELELQAKDYEILLGFERRQREAAEARIRELTNGNTNKRVPDKTD